MQRPFFQHSIFLALMACVLWSTAFAGIKIGLQYTTPLQFAGLRFMLAGIMILPFAKRQKSNFIILGKNIRKVLMISFFQTFVLYTLFYLGLNKTPAAIAAIIDGGGPLFVALLAQFTTQYEKLNARKVLALLVGFSGIVLLAMAKDQNAGNRHQVLLGMALLVGGNFSGSYGNILVSKFKQDLPPVLLNAVQIFLGGLGILIVSFFVEGADFSLKPLPYYMALLWLSMLSATAFTLWFVVLNRPEVKVSEINIWKFIIPMLGAILSWVLIKGEHPTWYTIMGMILIASAIVIIYFRRSKREIGK